LSPPMNPSLSVFNSIEYGEMSPDRVPRNVILSVLVVILVVFVPIAVLSVPEMIIPLPASETSL